MLIKIITNSYFLRNVRTSILYISIYSCGQKKNKIKNEVAEKHY